MKIFIISIVMWWGDPTMTPKNDAIEIGTMNGKPFYFTSQKDCFKHIDDNLEALKSFGKASFPSANAVKTIYCLEREKL